MSKKNRRPHKRYGNKNRKPSQEDVEFSQEVAPTSTNDAPVRDVDEREQEEGYGLGVTAIALSILSFFILPFVLGSAGVIIGAVSGVRGSTLGWWAVGVGILALVFRLFTLPIQGML